MRHVLYYILELMANQGMRYLPVSIRLKNFLFIHAYKVCAGLEPTQTTYCGLLIVFANRVMQTKYFLLTDSYSAAVIYYVCILVARKYP